MIYLGDQMIFLIQESIKIKNEYSPVALVLIELDLCERAIKSDKEEN